MKRKTDSQWKEYHGCSTVHALNKKSYLDLARMDRKPTCQFVSVLVQLSASLPGSKAKINGSSTLPQWWAISVFLSAWYWENVCRTPLKSTRNHKWCTQFTRGQGWDLSCLHLALMARYAKKTNSTGIKCKGISNASHVFKTNNSERSSFFLCKKFNYFFYGNKYNF
jgi:hypothetical protein